MDYVNLAQQAHPPINMADGRVFRANLLFIYGLIQASEGLLTVAATRSSGDLQSYFLSHLEEEKGHAALLRHDLETLRVTEFPLSVVAAQLAGSQYYYILHYHPALLLGYMAVLECAPMETRQVDVLESLYGPMRSLRLHAQKDPAHGRDVIMQINRQPVRLQDQISENALNVASTMQIYFEALDARDPTSVN